MKVEATIGIEKEFACISSTADCEHYILASDHMLQMVQKPIADVGWRVLPEYSEALLEVISPPVSATRIPELIDDLTKIDTIMTSVRGHTANGEPIYLSDKHSVALDRFVKMGGTFTRDIAQIVIQDDDRADLNSLISTLPPACFMEGNLHDVALRFAGFTALNITVSHPNWTVDNVLRHGKHRKIFGQWMFNRAIEFRRELNSDINSVSERNQLHNQFADWITMGFEQSISLSKNDIIRSIYGSDIFIDKTFKEKTNYLVRPRIIGSVVGAEFRCFNSNVPTENIKNIIFLLASEAKEII